MYPAWQRFLCIFPSDKKKKRNLCQVVFTIHQHSSKRRVGKISRSFGKSGHELTRSQQKNKHDQGPVVQRLISTKPGLTQKPTQLTLD